MVAHFIQNMIRLHLGVSLVIIDVVHVDFISITNLKTRLIIVIYNKQ